MLVVSTGWPEQDPSRRTERARSRANEFAALLGAPESPSNVPTGTAGTWQSNFSRDGYIKAAHRVIDQILDGDVFQVNIAQRFSARLSSSFDPLAFYCRLRSLKPAPFCSPLAVRQADHCIELARTIPEAWRTAGRNAAYQGHDMAFG